MLINSEHLITRYCQKRCGHHATVCRYPCEVVRMVREEPEAVVRCGECKHRDPEDKKCDCGAMERAGCVFAVGDDYFCASGERKEDNDA